MDKQSLHVIKGDRDKLYEEGRDALLTFAMTGDQGALKKLDEIDKRLVSRGDLKLASEAKK